MHYLYILYSNSTQKFYIGETNNIDERISKHQNHFYSNSFTKIANDWEVVLTFICNNKEEAIYLESFIKRMKSKVFNNKIIADPSIFKDILSKRNHKCSWFSRSLGTGGTTKTRIVPRLRDSGFLFLIFPLKKLTAKFAKIYAKVRKVIIRLCGLLLFFLCVLCG